MMETLDRLRDSRLYELTPDGEGLYTPVDTRGMADAIATEIGRWNLPRPVFDDGQPVAFGDRFGDGAGSHDVSRIVYTSTGVAVGDGGYEHYVGYTGALCRADTQERLELDADGLSARLADMTADEARAALTWLLARQRRICGEAR